MTRRLQALVCAALFAVLSSTPSDAARQKIIPHDKDIHAQKMPRYDFNYQQKLYPGPGRYERKVKRLRSPARKSALTRTVRNAATTGDRRPAVVWGRDLSAYADHVGRGSVSLAGVVPELAAFARRVVADCGSKVISAVRNTRVRGSGAISLHASGRAVDISGNPDCIARHIAAWGGGASNDYWRVRPNHYHISWGGREHGKRFAHYTGKVKRYARRGKSRWASAG